MITVLEFFQVIESTQLLYNITYYSPAFKQLSKFRIFNERTMLK